MRRTRLAMPLRALVLADARSAARDAEPPYVLVLADARSLAFLAEVPLALVLADARSLALLAAAPLALVLADARSPAFRAFVSLAPVSAHACLSLLVFLALVWPLHNFSLANMCFHARIFQVTRLHQPTGEGRHRRLQLLPYSMHRVTTAAHFLFTLLLFALSLHRRITTLLALLVSASVRSLVSVHSPP